MPFWFEKELTGINPTTLGLLAPFTKSNGTTLARIYERLTRRSRRAVIFGKSIYDTAMRKEMQRYYRKGVYDTLKALQQEVVN